MQIISQIQGNGVVVCTRYNDSSANEFYDSRSKSVEDKQSIKKECDVLTTAC